MKGIGNFSVGGKIYLLYCLSEKSTVLLINTCKYRKWALIAFPVQKSCLRPCYKKIFHCNINHCHLPYITVYEYYVMIIILTIIIHNYTYNSTVQLYSIMNTIDTIIVVSTV